MFKKIVVVSTEERTKDLERYRSVLFSRPCDIDFTNTTTSLNRLIENGYDLAIIELTPHGNIKIQRLLDLINLGYVTGKKILAIVNNTSDVAKIEKRIGRSIKESVNIKYVTTPLETEAMKKRLNQLELGSTKDLNTIFKEIETDVIKHKEYASLTGKVLSMLSF